MHPEGLGARVDIPNIVIEILMPLYSCIRAISKRTTGIYPDASIKVSQQINISREVLVPIPGIETHLVDCLTT